MLHAALQRLGFELTPHGGLETGSGSGASRPADAYVPTRPAPTPKRPDVLWTSNEAKPPYVAMVQQTAAHQR